MLSRVANALYWMGRYVERTEHLARYLNVQYFSTLDAPMSQKKDFVLNSVLNMAGLSEDMKNQLSEEEILVKIALDTENDSSIVASVQAGRENARSIRSVISTKLWESVNKYYHFVQNYPEDLYKTRGLYDFCMNAIQHCAVIRADIENTLIHNEVHAIIRLGIHIERAMQVTRILSTKLSDIDIIHQDKKNIPLEAYQWAITLKVLEAFDVSYRHYKKFPSKKNIVEFLVINTYFPRSIAYNIGKASQCIQSISLKKLFTPDSPEFYADKMTSYYKFLEYDEIGEDLQKFLNQTLENIYKLHDMLEQEYISY